MSTKWGNGARGSSVNKAPVTKCDPVGRQQSQKWANVSVCVQRVEGEDVIVAPKGRTIDWPN